jgi:hypothetical protein
MSAENVNSKYAGDTRSNANVPSGTHAAWNGKNDDKITQFVCSRILAEMTNGSIVNNPIQASNATVSFRLDVSTPATVNTTHVTRNKIAAPTPVIPYTSPSRARTFIHPSSVPRLTRPRVRYRFRAHQNQRGTNHDGTTLPRTSTPVSHRIARRTHPAHAREKRADAVRDVLAHRSRHVDPSVGARVSAEVGTKNPRVFSVPTLGKSPHTATPRRPDATIDDDASARNGIVRLFSDSNPSTETTEDARGRRTRRRVV